MSFDRTLDVSHFIVGNSGLSLDYAGIFNVAGGVLTLAVMYLIAKFVYTAIYRVRFDELSHIPGPAMAAATKLWWVYYNVIPHGGKLVFRLPELHRKYGPVVRISPTEV